MHETGIVRDLVQRLEAVARENGATAVSGVDVWLGALSQFSAGHFREHFDEEVRGTVAEAAKLRISTSTDYGHPNALDVMIESVDLDFPEETA